MFLKQLPLTLGITLLIASGCNKAQISERINSPDNDSQPQIVETTIPAYPLDLTAETANWKVYNNTEYGFQLTFTEAWKGYKVEKESDRSLAMTRYLLFKVPTSDSSYGDLSGYATRLSIGIFPLSEWKQLHTERNSRIPDVVAQNETYVFVYSSWQDPPKDLREVNFELQKVISTFKLNQ